MGRAPSLQPSRLVPSSSSRPCAIANSCVRSDIFCAGEKVIGAFIIFHSHRRRRALRRSIPERFSDIEAAPLLCAGLIGYRTLRAGGDTRQIRIYGFGAAAHIAAQVARFEGRKVYGFTRPGDRVAQDFARAITGGWTGGSDELPPEPLDAALIFAPIGALVPAALRALAPGGIVVCGGIHMSDIPAFPYEILWGERSICSVANLTRRDAEEFLPLAARIPIRTITKPYRLEDANAALADLRQGRLTGAAVLMP